MKGHIVVVHRADDGYSAKVVGVRHPDASGSTVEEALSAAGTALKVLAKSGADLPPARPAISMLDEVKRRDAVAGGCLRVA